MKTPDLIPAGVYKGEWLTVEYPAFFNRFVEDKETGAKLLQVRDDFGVSADGQSWGLAFDPDQIYEVSTPEAIELFALWWANNLHDPDKRFLVEADPEPY